MSTVLEPASQGSDTLDDPGDQRPLRPGWWLWTFETQNFSAVQGTWDPSPSNPREAPGTSWIVAMTLSEATIPLRSGGEEDGGGEESQDFPVYW